VIIHQVLEHREGCLGQLMCTYSQFFSSEVSDTIAKAHDQFHYEAFCMAHVFTLRLSIARTLLQYSQFLAHFNELILL
jgi:hypothetical protein